MSNNSTPQNVLGKLPNNVRHRINHHLVPKDRASLHGVNRSHRTLLENYMKSLKKPARERFDQMVCVLDLDRLVPRINYWGHDNNVPYWRCFVEVPDRPRGLYKQCMALENVPGINDFTLEWNLTFVAVGDKVKLSGIDIGIIENPQIEENLFSIRDVSYTKLETNTPVYKNEFHLDLLPVGMMPSMTRPIYIEWMMAVLEHVYNEIDADSFNIFPWMPRMRDLQSIDEIYKIVRHLPEDIEPTHKGVAVSKIEAERIRNNQEKLTSLERKQKSLRNKIAQMRQGLYGTLGHETVAKLMDRGTIKQHIKDMKEKTAKNVEDVEKELVQVNAEIQQMQGGATGKDKIFNPKTKRYVCKTGKVGKALVSLSQKRK